MRRQRQGLMDVSHRGAVLTKIIVVVARIIEWEMQLLDTVAISSQAYQLFSGDVVAIAKPTQNFATSAYTVSPLYLGAIQGTAQLKRRIPKHSTNLSSRHEPQASLLAAMQSTAHA